MFAGRVNGLTIVGIAFFIFLIFQIVLDRAESRISPALLASAAALPTGSQTGTGEVQPAVDPDAVAAPYTAFTLTQGPHGFSYGHMAIDLTAGNGATILSPIHGMITQKFIDEWGNPTLVIENEHYQVTLLHGKYSVELDQQVALGAVIGTESNRGYTLDYLGQSCYNRDCGYHTHLNIFDKQLGENVNPLDLITK